MIKLAWRSLWRNRGRTLIGLSAIAFSLALMLISFGINDDAHGKMEETAIETAGGNILVHAEGYWDTQTGDRLIRSPEPVLEAARGLPGVRAVIPRFIITGLVSSARGGSGIRITGIDPEAESRLRDVAQHLVEGDFLDGDEKRPLVLGRTLVEDLGVELGDRVVIRASGPDGEVTQGLFRLSGIVDMGAESLDRAVAFTTIPAAQRAMKADGMLTQIALLLEDDAERHATRDALASALGEQRSDLELLTWDEAMPEMVGFIEIDDAFGYIYAIVIFIIVAFGIANTFLMGVLERIREFGLLGALGLRPTRIAGVVLAESLMLGLIAVAIGLTLGLIGHAIIDSQGINYAEMMGDDIELAGIQMTDLIIRSRLDLGKWLGSSFAVIALVVMSALYPAWRATRLNPATAMRTYE